MEKRVYGMRMISQFILNLFWLNSYFEWDLFKEDEESRIVVFDRILMFIRCLEWVWGQLRFIKFRVKMAEWFLKEVR